MNGRFRLRRSGTILASKNYQDELPGQEPGLDPNDSRVKLHTECGITVVDFSEDDIVQTELGNVDLLEFLEKPREDWVGVRWINCNGQPRPPPKSFDPVLTMYRSIVGLHPSSGKIQRSTQIR